MSEWISFLRLGIGLFIAVGAAASPGAELGEGLKAALEQAGWRVTEGPDGSLDLRPPPGETPEQPRAAEVGAVGEGPTSGEGAGWARLTEHGWRVERSADGSTLLYPPEPAARPSPPETEAETPDKPTPISLPSERLDDHLRARGWHVERSPDGSLLLHPQRTEAVATQRQTPEPCAGELPAVVRDARVRLPIASWDQARAVAESWLESVESPGSLVGKIRQIGRVYLVSIVERRSPHRLRHQIAIDSESGRVIVLN